MDLNKKQDLLDRTAFQEVSHLQEDMHQFDRTLALKSAQRNLIPMVEYEAFTKICQRFNGRPRRIRDTFHKAKLRLTPLTGLYVRHFLMKVHKQECAVRTYMACDIVLTDIDRFKFVNKTYGNAAGDLVPQTAVGRCLAKLRLYHEMFLYVGKELLICLRDADTSVDIEVVETAVLVRDRAASITCQWDQTAINGSL